MAEKRYIHIRNWDRFQHYKTRPGRITWIKDYVAQLSDDDWLALTFAQRGLLQGLRLMYASRSPLGIDENIARTTLSTNKGESRHFRGHLDSLSHAGFIVLSSSKRLDDCNESARPEGETEREEETEKNQDQEPNPTQPVARPPHDNGHDLPPEFQPPPTKNGWGDGKEKGLEPIAQTAAQLIKQLRGAA